MQYGLVDIQRSLDDSGQAGLDHAGALEKQREQSWEQIEAADDASRKQAIGAGMGSGAAIGTGIMPGIGTAVGAVAGAALGYLTYEFL